MKVRNILVSVVLAMIASFAQAEGFSCPPDFETFTASDGTIICNFKSKPLTAEEEAKIDAELAEEMAKMAVKKAAVEAKLAAKKAAAEAYLQKDVIKMTSHLKDHAGKPITIRIETYPEAEKGQNASRKGQTLFRGSGDPCDQGLLDTVYTKTSEGDISIDLTPRLWDCSKLRYVINPETRKVTIYVTPLNSLMLKSSLLVVLEN